MKKPPSCAVTRRRFCAVFALLGVGHPRWGDFEKSALKSPETRMNTKKIGVTSISSPLLGPSDWSRTSGLLNPIQARYQSALHPEMDCR